MFETLPNPISSEHASDVRIILNLVCSPMTNIFVNARSHGLASEGLGGAYRWNSCTTGSSPGWPRSLVARVKTYSFREIYPEIYCILLLDCLSFFVLPLQAEYRFAWLPSRAFCPWSIDLYANPFQPGGRGWEGNGERELCACMWELCKEQMQTNNGNLQV